MAEPWESIKNAYAKARKLGVAKVALSGKILDCNRAFAEIIGRDKAAAIGQNILTDLTLPQDIEVSQERFRTLASGDEHVVASEKKLRTPSGKTVAVWFEACLVVDLKDKPLYIIDALWKVGTLPSELEDLEVMLGVLKEKLVSTQQQPTIQITGADMGNKINAGGDYVGRNKTTNDNRQVGILVGGVVVLALAFSYAMYYMATTATNNPPEPPVIEQPEQPEV